jgi:aminoglycoside/choline kinase family phosphotransferase
MVTLNAFMNSKIQTFLTEHFGTEAISTLKILAQSGSSRNYYRFEFGNESFILTESDNVEENETFLYFTNHFSKIMDNLPVIKEVSMDLTMYVQSDLGNQSLMDVLESDREGAKPIFIRAIKKLVKMQVVGSQNLDYSQAFSYPKFNYLLVLRDLFSFKNYFLNLSGWDFNQGKLLRDFENFAHDFEKIPEQYFVYRDFQSRNIMVKNGKPYFIDYQGGMNGPVQYDLVSLIWQAKANFSKEWKEEFYEIYVKEFIDATQIDLESSYFRKGYQLCLIERLLQVLGAYGFRGIYERKAHFLSSIEFALKNLGEIQDLELLNQYPEMKSVIQKLAETETFIKLKKRINE